MEEINTEVHKAFEVVAGGGTILYPTDTGWAIGCDAGNPEAVARVYAIKKRPSNLPMSVIINGDRMLHQIFKEIPEVGWQILELNERPTTLVLDQPKNVASNLLSLDGSLAIRIVKAPFCFKLMERLKRPLVATSARIQGAATPKSYKEISTEVLNAVDYIVNLEREKTYQELSSVIKLTRDSQVTILRK
jgi:L-threonylcarbamoyladenylate synthase